MKSSGSMEGADFEEWLDRQLQQVLGSERGPRPRPAQARYGAASHPGGSKLVMIKSSLLAALGTKAAVGGVAVALAAGTAAAATASTGSVSPVSWGQHVVQAVQGCKQEVRVGAASAPRNVGVCVSAIASQHGAEERARHGQGPASTPGTPAAMPGRREGREGAPPRGGNGAGNGVGRGNPPASPGATPGVAGQNGHGNHVGRGQGQPTPEPTP